MTTAKQLETKIQQLTSKVTELKKQSDIDPLTASPDQIIKNAQSESAARESAAELEKVITQLRSQLEIEGRRQEAEGRRKQVEDGYQSLVEQGDRVKDAVIKLELELAKLREIGTAIAPQHKQETNRLALDDRISRDFRLPIVEDLGNSIVLHTEPRKYLK